MNNFWGTERVNSLIKLIAWLAFILIVYLVMTFGIKSKPVTPQEDAPEEEVNKEETITSLLDKDFTYTYHVTIGEEKYTFEGKILGNLEEGYKQDNDGTIVKYQIENNEVYQVINEEKTLISNLYENMQAEFLDYKFIDNIIQEHVKTTSPYEYSYLDYYFLVNKDRENSITVTITKDNASYELVYSNIGSEEK